MNFITVDDDCRSDPGPTLLQPLVVINEERKRKSFPSSSSRNLDESTSTTNKESSPPRKRIQSSYRKLDVEEGGRIPVVVEKKRKKLSIKSEGYFARLMTSQGSDTDDVDEDTGNNFKDGDGNEGYQAPYGMTFMPLSSACDESTDGELEI